MTVNRVVGVDFSAAARSAGDNTWLAVCRRTDAGLAVQELATAAELLDTDGSRETTLPALVAFLAEPPAPTAVGLDVPFALPAEFLGFGGGSTDENQRGEPDELWTAFVADTPEKWGLLGELDGPEALYEQARETAERRGFPRTRATDETYGGQEPAGYRIRTQTFYGISAVLAPLVERGARVSPVHPDPDADLTLLETYPAAVFDALPDATREGYKSDSRAGVAARGRNRAALREAGVTFGDTTADCMTATDDALDAVAAAYAAANDHRAAVEDQYTPRERVEAVIFDGTRDS